MRKRFCWIFGMCLILSLSACGELEESQEDGSSGQGDSAQIVQEETIDLSHIFQGKNIIRETCARRRPLLSQPLKLFLR